MTSVIDSPPEPIDQTATAAKRAMRRRAAWRIGVAGTAIVACYHTSLWTLMRGVTVDTPLAYLGLVPLIAGALWWYLARPRDDELDLHDRHLDLIVGIPFIAVALTVLIAAPPHLTTMYWLWRIDLLTLPLFAAGVVALLFGARTLWRTKMAVLFLFFAWPIPFRGMVTRLLEPMSDATAKATAIALKLIPLAAPALGDGATFEVDHGDGFLVTIASACSGANGVVGFLLVGSAIAIAMQGRRTRKLLWLAAGLLLVWALNLVRIIAILGVGRLFGETASVEVLHPFVGLLTFNIATLTMLLLTRRFGLTPRPRHRDRLVALTRPVPRPAFAMCVVMVVALIGATYDHGLTKYDPVSSSVGSTKLLPFRFGGLDVASAHAQNRTHYDNGRRFFGESSTWVRYQYRYTGQGEPRSNVGVIADVINTDNLQSFSDFGIEACYRFHGFAMSDVTSVDLGHGITGNLLRWTQSDNGMKWISLYWIWPVRQGESNRFERVVLLLPLDKNLRLRLPELSSEVRSQLQLSDEEAPAGGTVGFGVGSERARVTNADVDAFMAGFAIDVVDATVKRSEATGDNDAG